MPIKTSYLKWKVKTIYNRYKIKNLYDPLKVYWIDPRKIQTSFSHPALDRTNPKQKQRVSPMFERGMIVGGDWDIDTTPFEKMDVWQAFSEHFEQNAPWEKTAYYKRILNTINKGIPLWNCKTEDEFKDRLKYLDRLFDRIKREGYKPQSETEDQSKNPLSAEDEINVHIGRNGEYIFGDGRHRLCVAKILGLAKIPVKIARRHEKWVDFRKEILTYAKNHEGSIRNPIFHPDLNDIPYHHGDHQMRVIKKNLASASGKMLDIGAHWGYFSQCFSNIGFDCTAIESLPENIYYMKKLRDANRADFQILEGSVFDFDNSEKEYDVTLALGMSHAFWDEKEYFKTWLGNLRTRQFFFESLLPNEDQNELVSIIRKFGHFKINTPLGCSGDNGKIYLFE